MVNLGFIFAKSHLCMRSQFRLKTVHVSISVGKKVDHLKQIEFTYFTLISDKTVWTNTSVVPITKTRVLTRI